ncbi:hypothetical protein PHLH8_10170 [Pseudomonas sp. Pc102]|uniref:hypothetical protein n=1 Tax=Pseudomonas sp. Pc102 TaxID=2678261 RepID=UPI001BCE1212|nr:hypothetical protein [Pseudomonas sp. Pc102]BBP81375.1 hypothetical protein PHLH8_10170 [Pseudomonas sp. Pc102]
MSWWKRFTRHTEIAPTTQDAPAAAPEAAPGKPGIELRQGTAEFERFITEAELEQGNLAHGAEHLAELLRFAPANPEWLALAERYLQRAGTPAEAVLLPPGEQRYAATEALRSWIMAREGRVAAAVDLLLQVIDAAPESDYLDAWALDWLEPAGSLEQLDADLQMRLFGRVIQRTPEAREATARDLANTRRWAVLAGRIRPADDFTAQWTMLHIGLLRRAALFDQALELAGPVQARQDWHQATARGLVLRQQGRPAEADLAFSQAMQQQPEELSTYLEAGDTWLENQGWAQATSWYDQALALHPEHPWAAPSRDYCQWRASGDDTLLQRVIDAAKADNERAYQLWFLASGAPPQPNDASANVLRKIRDSLLDGSYEGSPGDSITLRTSSLEAPSNVLAITLELAAHGLAGCKVEVTAESIAQPDPRQPHGPVEHLLWRYEGDQALPALPPPGEKVSALIAGLAARPYARANWAQASQVAASLTGDEPLQVLATLVHPPAVPDRSIPALVWLTRVQSAAAQVLAHLDQGWEGSRRRALLLSALFGPSDWTTVAAIRVLAAIAHDEPAHALDIHTCFERLEGRRPDSGYCCWLEPLYESWQQLPLLFDHERKTLRQKLAELQEVDDESA